MSSKSPIFRSIVKDPELMAEIQDRSKKTLASFHEIPLAHRDFKAVFSGATPDNLDSQNYAEAIIRLDGRPSLLVSEDTFAEPELEYWKSRLNPYRESLKSTINSVGRVELTGHSSYQWVGTGWVLGDRLVATNRHVANIFAQRQGQGFVFRQNEEGHIISAYLDFNEEYRTETSREIPIVRILYIAPDLPGQPDIAVLELGSDSELPSPIRIAPSSAIRGTPIAVIGYPAYDTRNSDDAIRKIFKDIYDVKRFAPGNLMPSSDEITLQHDCSTLGGNSGSAVINVQTGEAIGLHFGGSFRARNYAVKAEIIRSVLGKLPAGRAIFAPISGQEGPTVASLAGREGYKPDFLGHGKRVNLPNLSADQAEDAVPVPGRTDFVLAYTHFSVIMCQSRRLCYFTAVNIDGDQSVNLRRTGSWALDPRIPEDSQCGNELYESNNLDRGHMVRRLDPVWGSNAIAKQANNDTFMYTNSCPQHAQLNQGIWNDLEDYILNNADERNLKVTGFTGPVFRSNDPVYRGVKIPQDFWKVIVMVKANGQLSATAYMLTQKQLIGDLEAPGFVFGQFRTYQVSVRKIEILTGYSFGNLPTFDPLGVTEAVSEPRVISSANDLIL